MTPRLPLWFTSTLSLTAESIGLRGTENLN
jgi:hypothetical protein